MAHLVDKDALVAKIKKIYDEDYKFLPSDIVESVRDFKDDLLITLDTIEVKEVNLEKEIKNRINSLCYLYCYMEDLFNGNVEEGVYPIPEKVTNELFDIAKHFFELVLKARNGE